MQNNGSQQSGKRWILGRAGGVAMVVILVALSLVLTEFQMLLVSQMLIAALFAMSLNLILGYGGMVHFGHAAFYGLGAYTVAILTTRYHLPPFLTWLLAPLISALAAVIIGWFCVRRMHLYFAILTLTFSQLLFIIVSQARDFTGGDDGIHAIPVPGVLDGPVNFYLFTLFVCSLCFIALRLITRSPFVLTLRAIRENPERAQFIGVNVRHHQLLTFVIGAFFAGIAGALMSQLNRFVAPDMLFWTTSAEPILASLLGGMFSLIGPAIGAVVLTFLNVFITRYTELWPLVLGSLTVIAVLAAPTGLVGVVDRLFGATSEEDGI